MPQLVGRFGTIVGRAGVVGEPWPANIWARALGERNRAAPASSRGTRSGIRACSRRMRGGFSWSASSSSVTGRRNGQGFQGALGVGGLERQLDLGGAEGVRREDQAERDRLEVVEPEVMGIERPVIRVGCARSRRRGGVRSGRSSSRHGQGLSRFFRFPDRFKSLDMLAESLLEREAERLELASSIFSIFQAGQSLSG